MNLNSRRSYLKSDYPKYQQERLRISTTLFETVRKPDHSFTIETFMDSLQLFLAKDRIIGPIYKRYIADQVRIYLKHGHLLQKMEDTRITYTTKSQTDLPPYTGEPFTLSFQIPLITKRAKKNKRK